MLYTIICSRVECEPNTNIKHGYSKMIDFGGLLKRFRASNFLSQNEFVDLVTGNDNRLVGLDVVTISRWENWVVVPTHRRQIEVFRAASQPLFDYILNNSDLLASEFDYKLIKKSYVWESSEYIELSNVRFREIRSKDENGNTVYCNLYTDEKGIPIGQITYKYLSQNDFWKILHKSPSLKDEGVENDICLQIMSMFCLSDKILPHMLGNIVTKLLSKKVDIIGFYSENKKSNLKRFLKSIGFKVHKEQENNTSLILTYYDALYNKELFYCSVLVEIKGDINVQEM